MFCPESSLAEPGGAGVLAAPAAVNQQKRPGGLMSDTTRDDHYFSEVVIRNQKGLHARASAAFVKCVSAFDSEVLVTREGQVVGGTSIMGLMMLAAGPGNTILVETKGPDAKQALDAIIALVESGFGEGR